MKKQIKYILNALIMIFLSSILLNICMNHIILSNFEQLNYVTEDTYYKIDKRQLEDNQEYQFEYPVYRGEPYEIINPVYKGEPIEFKFLTN